MKSSALAFRCLIVLFLAIVFLVVAMHSQTALGTISGRVADPSDAVVVGAKVTAKNLATNVTVTTETSPEGLYTIANLPAGNYEIAVEKEGFRRAVRSVALEVAQRLTVDIPLQVGATAETVEVTSDAIAIRTTSAEVSREITTSELANMPLLTRNPYNLVLLAPGAVDTQSVNGDNYGLGVAVSGARTRSINFLLDGSENNETFGAGPSTLVPVDAIQEFRVQTNSMTAEFGRNALQANVITRSGGNTFHGSAYEFYRGSALSTWTAEDKANKAAYGSPTTKQTYVRNVFGGAIGGPVIRDKTFFFGALEGTRVRSSGRNFYYVPTQAFFDAASSNMQAYLNAGGGIPEARLGGVITAGQIAAMEGIPGLTTAAGVAIPSSTPLFQHTYIDVPVDAGGGVAQNTWSLVSRVDHQISDRTNLTGRWAWYRQLYPVGAGTDSPYSAFNTGYSFRSQNGSLGLTHSWSDKLFSESRLTFSRTIPESPLGQGDVNVACVQYFTLRAFGDPIVFPGYLPQYCGAFAIPSGGPQNTYSGYHSFTYSQGKHTWKWGAYARHLRDNHTFGALQNANVQTASMQHLIDGLVDRRFQLAFDPKGLVPGEMYSIATNGVLSPPSFTRHYRYNEFALYLEDSVKLMPRLTLTAGVRWEYFGVLHSPSAERFLDANLYLDMVGTPAALTPGGKSVFAQIRDARFARTGNFFNQDYNNFAPRLGLAWDVSGNARTVFRAGYGVFYDANFGNALFNAIQNPPNYAVVSVTPGQGGIPATGPILPNQYDSLAALMGGGASFRISSSARMLDREMVTAYSQQWNATLEHDVLGKGIFASLGYVGAKGDKLYSLNNLNQLGACVMLGRDYCQDNAYGRLNTTGLTGMNRRGNEGWSRYHGLQLQVKTREIAKSGLQLASNYTWAHSIDNASSFFGDSIWEGNYGFGFLNPFNPSLDKANSTNDIRHRFTINYAWTIPWSRNLKGVVGQVLGNWMLTGIYTAQSGVAFPIYDDMSNSQCTNSATNFCYPILTGALPKPISSTIPEPGGTPNRFVYMNTANIVPLDVYCEGDDWCMSDLLFSMSKGPFLPRNAFRGPGMWTFDAAVLKDFPLPRESMKLQFRAEFFNVLNHSNLFLDTNTVGISSGQVWSTRGNPAVGNPERRNIQLALRLQF